MKKHSEARLEDAISLPFPKRPRLFKSPFGCLNDDRIPFDSAAAKERTGFTKTNPEILILLIPLILSEIFITS